MKKNLNETTYKELPQLITVSQAAKLLGVHVNTIRRWEKEGRLKAKRIGDRRDRRIDKDELLNKILNIKIIDGRKEAYQKYFDYLKKLFKKASDANARQFLFNILQVTGMHYGHWDPTYEIQSFFKDFNRLLDDAVRQKKQKRKFRLGLLMYCHALEMSLPFDLIANIFIIIKGGNYLVDPFSQLKQNNKKGFPVLKPLSIKRKIEYLKELAMLAGEKEFVGIINEFFNDQIRNSFYHSDYCLTNSEFRYYPDGFATSIKLKSLESIITKCFAFYEAFFHVHAWAKMFYKGVRTYHKLPNYEILELLKNDKEVYGFKMHFSNGQIAKFSREPEKVETININLGSGSNKEINFFVGNFDKLKKEWILNGKPYKEKTTRK